MKEAELLEHLKGNPFLLAPMAGITDRAFRSYMRKMGCGIVVTELVSANGLQYQSERTRRLMDFSSDQHPVGVQIFGERLDALAVAAKEVEQSGANFVDLNFGCPVPKVVKKGAGAAILKDLVGLRQVLRTVKQATKLPVTIKIRTGWDEATRNAHEVAKVAADEGITWVAIHGRTRALGYKGEADWKYIKEVKQSASIPIIGNGDITSAALARRRLSDSGCDGVMIGRGCLKNPWLFEEAQREEKVPRDYWKTILGLKQELDQLDDERIISLQLKKFSAWYAAGFQDAAKFRKSVFQIKELNELLSHIENYFSSVSHELPADTSHEPFLMGGHG